MGLELGLKWARCANTSDERVGFRFKEGDVIDTAVDVERVEELKEKKISDAIARLWKLSQ